MTLGPSRSSELLNSVPPATLAIISLCSVVYGFQLLLDPELHHYTLNPRSIIYLHEYYRLITSTLFHGSLMHIGMNMMSTFAISPLLEHRFGTIRHAMTILWAMLLTSTTYTLVAYILQTILGYDKLMFQHAVGFSGVIFHLSVIECNLKQGNRSIFGIIHVPSYLYPWVLLVVLQFIMPNLSFMGHLAGIITGTLQSYGALDFMLVGEMYAKEMEGWTWFQSITSQPNFVSTPSGGDITVSREGGLSQATWRAAHMIINFIKHILETLHYIVMGRTQDTSAGAARGTSTVAVRTGMNDFDDDDWVGLPPMVEAADPELSRLL